MQSNAELTEKKSLTKSEVEEQTHILKTMCAYLSWYLGVFSSTSKYQTQRAFSSPRQPKEVSQAELKA